MNCLISILACIFYVKNVEIPKEMQYLKKQKNKTKTKQYTNGN